MHRKHKRPYLNVIPSQRWYQEESLSYSSPDSLTLVKHS